VRAPDTHRRSPINGPRHHDFVTAWIGPTHPGHPQWLDGSTGDW
jgi:hypothetical protein